jgi:hypothetical protein
MVITAKFSSTCPACRQFIAVGDKVEWTRGEKAAHVACPQVAPATVEQAIAPVRKSVDEVGVYVLTDGTIVKVQANLAKTATYTKVLVEIGGMRATESGERVNAEYQYAPDLMWRVVSQGHRMELDEAKAFILRYGFCARCGRQLKAAVSVERGIGPVCVQYFAGEAASSPASEPEVEDGATVQPDANDALDASYDREIERQMSIEPAVDDWAYAF